MRLSAPHTPELDDENAEIVRLEHERKIVELQNRPLVVAGVIYDVALADGVATPVAHGMGRRVAAFPSAPRGAVSAGYIVETRSGTHDPSKYVVLTANGFGATITVDLEVV